MIVTNQYAKDRMILEILEWLYVRGVNMHGLDENIERKFEELQKIIEEEEKQRQI